MVARVNSPTVREHDVGYLSECKFAIEPSALKLIEMAVDAGWRREEVAHSLMLVAASVMSD